MGIISVMFFLLLNGIIFFAIAMRGKSLYKRIKMYKADKDTQSLLVELGFFLLVLIVSFLIHKYLFYDIWYIKYFKV